MDKVAKSDASLQYRKFSPEPHVIRQCIESGVCPFCGDQFKNIAAHTNRTHGVDRFELKEMAGIPKSAPACSPEFTAECSDRAKRDISPERISKLRAAKRTGKRVYSDAGRAVQAAKLRAPEAIERRRFAVAEMDPNAIAEARRRAAETNSRRRRAAVYDRDCEIVRRLDSGESSEDIQAEMNISVTTVKGALKRLGANRDLRKDAANRDTRKQKSARNLARAHEIAQAESEALAEERISRWRQLGETWEALSLLAEEWGVNEKTVRAYLRSCGAAVPDGRLVSPRRRGNRSPRPLRLCEVAGCEAKHLQHGMCQRHFSMWKPCRHELTAKQFIAIQSGAS